MAAQPKFVVSVPVPSMGATVMEMTLVALHVAPGTDVHQGQRLAEWESDKSAFDFESPCAGRVLRFHPRPGDVVPCGAPFLDIETDDAAMAHLKDAAAPVVPAPAVPAPAAPRAPAPTPPPEPVPVAPAPAAKVEAASLWTPRAVKVARDNGRAPEDLVGIVGTGPGGRISGDDVLAFLARQPAVAAPVEAGVVAAAQFRPFPEETVRMAGLGFVVPGNVRTNADILAKFPGMTEAEILKLTGIRERFYADKGQTATGLAAEAARLALRQSGLEAGAIDAVILATILPDQPVPSTASALAGELGMRHALAFDLNAACSGWLYALEVGRSFIRTGTARNVLVATAELLSRITDPADQATAFLFGDGAGAAVLTGGEGGHRLGRMQLSGDAQFYRAIRREGGGAIMPVPDASGDRSPFFLHMDGPVVFKQAVGAFARILETLLERHGLQPGDVAWVVPHQANERILRAVSQRVGIPFERFVVTIGRFGNTSAASVSMALGWADQEGLLNAGDKILFCSVGAGLTFAGGLLVW